jgi:hypothetical protein
VHFSVGGNLCELGVFVSFDKCAKRGIRSVIKNLASVKVGKRAAERGLNLSLQSFECLANGDKQRSDTVRASKLRRREIDGGREVREGKLGGGLLGGHEKRLPASSTFVKPQTQKSQRKKPRSKRGAVFIGPLARGLVRESSP